MDTSLFPKSSIRFILILMMAGLFALFSSCDNITDPNEENNDDNVEHNSSISSDETWDKDKVHIISGYVSITNATVTIEPGATVIFKDAADLTISTGGGLIADGTTAAITFTGETKQPGFWDYIEFRSDAVNANCIMRNCVIEYGGGYSTNGAMVYIENNVEISNSTVRHSESNGVEIDENAAPLFNGNTITSNAKSPIVGDFENLGYIGQGSYSGNGNDFIDLLSGTLTDNATLLMQDIPYRMNGYNNIDNATLTIEPGTTILMNANADITINTGAGFIADGTPAEAIVFTGATAQNGFWDYIEFESDAVNANCVMDYCVVEYGGGYSSNGAMIYVDNAPTITNSIIRHSASNAVKIDNNARPTFTGNTITLNDLSPVLGDFESIGSIGVGNYTGNTRDYLDIQSGELNDDITLLAQDTPYRLNGYNAVRNAVLTIQAGTVIEMNANADLDISTNGGIMAIGTSETPIIFTGAVAQKGYWDYLEVDDDAVQANCQMDYCVIEWGGGYSTSGAMIYLNSSNASLTNSTIQHSDSWGIRYRNGSNPDLNGNTYLDNTLGNIDVN